MFTIFFLCSFSLFFFLHLPSHSLLPSPQKPKIVLPSSSKSISQNPKPKSQSQMEQKSKPKNHDFNTRAPWVWRSQNWRIFSIVGLCFQFFLLHLNPFLKIPNPNHDLNRSKNCFLWVRGSCFLGKNYWFVFSGQKVLEGVPRGFS